MQTMSTTPTYPITDQRTPDFFKKTSFSMHKRADVLKALDKAIAKGATQHACHWIAEALCSGMLDDATMQIIQSYATHVNIANPRAPAYLYRRLFETYRILEKAKLTDKPLAPRNHPQVRAICNEIVALLSESPHRALIAKPKISPNTDFDMREITTRLDADITGLVAPYVYDDDPPELHIAGNELVFHLLQRKFAKTVYWVSWLCTWERHIRKTQKTWRCHPRPVEGIDKKYTHELVWFLWAIFMRIAKERCVEPVRNQIQELFRLYCLRWNKKTKQRKEDFFIIACAYICEPPNFAVPLVHNRTIIEQAVKRADLFYREIQDGILGIEQTYIQPRLEYVGIGAPAPTAMPTTTTATTERARKREAQEEREREIADRFALIDKIFKGEA